MARKDEKIIPLSTFDPAKVDTHRLRTSEGNNRQPILYTHWRGPSWWRIGTSVVATAAFAGLMAAAQLGTERKRGGPDETKGRITLIEKERANESIGEILKVTRTEACNMLHKDPRLVSSLLTQLQTAKLDEFNWYSLVFPAHVVIPEKCTVTAKIDVRIPYIYAKTFTEVQQVNGEFSKKVLGHFAELLKL
jgi:hypothetical protein